MLIKEINSYDDRVNFVSLKCQTTWELIDREKDALFRAALSGMAYDDPTVSLKSYKNLKEYEDFTSLIREDKFQFNNFSLMNKDYQTIELEGQLKLFEDYLVRIALEKNSQGKVIIDIFTIDHTDDIVKKAHEKFFDSIIDAIEIKAYSDVSVQNACMAERPLFLEKDSPEAIAEKYKYFGKIFYKGNLLSIDRSLPIHDIVQKIKTFKSDVDFRG